MERLHWIRHRLQRLLPGDGGRGWYSPASTLSTKRSLDPPDSPDPGGRRLSGKRRSVTPRHAPGQSQHGSSRNYQGNGIRTTKYSLLSFIPKNLFEQFHRVANLYFLFLVLLNWVPVVEAFQKEITMIPLAVVLFVIAVKDALEDYRRYRYDQRVNNTSTSVYCGKQRRYVERRWAEVCVGDLVRLYCNDIIPADMVLLHSSDPGGVCHIETANLDGESNLKLRRVVRDLQRQGLDFSPETFSSRIECENPNNELQCFRGYMEHPSKARVGLHIENLLLRTCTVRNTEMVVGFVVYAGHETKAMQNNSGPRYKRSKLERRLNTDVLWSVALLLLLCFTAAVGHGLWLNSLKNPFFLIPGDPPPLLAGFYMFWTMIIVLQVLIPISLYVSIEIVKLGQIYFIQSDVDLYSEQTASGVQCRALNITEDLGQIQYLFSDKTGTLTENCMLFRRCTIAGVEYPHHDNAQWLEQYEEQDTHSRPHTLRSRCSRKSLSCRSLSCNRSSVSLHTLASQSDTASQEPAHAHGAFSRTMECMVAPDPLLQLKLQELPRPEGAAAAELSYILDFFLALAVCNTVVVSSPTKSQHVVPVPRTPQRSLEDMKLLLQKFSLPRFPHAPSSLHPDTPAPAQSPAPSSFPAPSAEGAGLWEECDDDDCGEELFYESESPDEAALVQAARAYGYTLQARSAEHLVVALPGSAPLTVPLLHLLPFHSDRKRMSVVVRHPVTGRVVVFTKGADSVVMELKDPGSNPTYYHRTQRHLDDYAREGLRTLCVAKRVLEEAEYEAWLKKHVLAETSIENREELLLDSAQRLETNLTLLGATGIVDRLQDDVPETIEALQRAGIRMWVLTGDKQETAVNIAYACRLLRPSDQLLTANCESKDACEALFSRLSEEIHRWEESQAASVGGGGVSGFTLVIDGRTLDWALGAELQGAFLQLTQHCRSVICCRSTPLQKSQVVRLVRDTLGVTTLAVGDGANDVSMIQVADVGIGISGQEGMQAVMSSDFAVSRFKHLRKLLLVHGHWCYTRLANMILYFFYKNVMYVNLLFWYQFFCGFSGSVMTNSWALIFFNLLFTSAPPLLYGILDKDVSADALLGVPQLYASGQNSEAYCRTTFWLTLLDSFYQSLVCFFVPYLAFAGSDVSIFSFGSPINSSALLIILLHQVIESRTLTWLHGAVLLGSAAFYYGFSLLFSVLCVTCNSPTDPLGVETHAMSQPLYYCVCVLTTVLALLPRVSYHAFHNTICPPDTVRAGLMDRLVSKEYWTHVGQWTDTPAPQTLSVNADPSSTTDRPPDHHNVLS
uniref:Phospholipid-transporting ATPase n=1 Tax=Denticeps clupeoides TaxID=299321 RepID=A0AAY4CDE5_9TELE